MDILDYLKNKKVLDHLGTIGKAVLCSAKGMHIPYHHHDSRKSNILGGIGLFMLGAAAGAGALWMYCKQQEKVCSCCGEGCEMCCNEESCHDYFDDHEHDYYDHEDHDHEDHDHENDTQSDAVSHEQPVEQHEEQPVQNSKSSKKRKK